MNLEYANFLASKAARAPLPEWLVSGSAEPLAALSYRHCGKTVYIYALVDPRTGLIRYIGKTIQSAAARLMAHLQDRGRCHRVNWIAELSRLGLKPEIRLIERLEGSIPWQEAERHWIAYGRKNGWPLTNNTSGGDGVSDLPPETRARMRLTWLGRKHSEETKQRLSVARRGRITKPETRIKQREAMTGRKILWIDKISEANRKLTTAQTEEITTRLAAGERVTDLACEFGVHRTTLSKIKTGKYFNELAQK